MKKKCISTATLSVLLLVLFLPVFYYIVFYGTNMNYNEMHKIITVEGNKVLSLCAVIGVAVLGAAYYFLRKIPYTGRIAVWFTGITLAVCILFCLVNIKISKALHFTVAGIAAWWPIPPAGFMRARHWGMTITIRSTVIIFPLHGFCISCILLPQDLRGIPTIRNLSGSSSSASCCHWRYSVQYFWSFRSAGTLEFP